MEYHNPVLLNECIEGLNINPKGIYVDVTFGGGGHSKLILKNLDGGKLYAFDQDENAHKNALEGDSFKLINANFRYLKNFLRMEGIRKIDGLLADLGVSSHQFDVAERGFSIRFDGELDMRMNTNSPLSAKSVVNEYGQENLANVLFKYGELRNSRAIAREIINAREVKEIVTTNQLIAIVEKMVPEKKRNQFLARIFQAIRIEVNDEMKALEEMLLSAVDMLNEGGRLVVLSYHSLEDRMVKNLMKKGNLEGKLQKDFFGNPIKDLKEITRKVIVASEDQVVENTRARSAKLRIAEKS
ncbi:MAG: 16S rRNA (cytosine(1402)-N(4))-methyltransferase RsmH [Flavobacteriales bacterium]|jgi:16S rRNA (cytosine1402-N4)-methyltransferase|nr:16S rRNA (cytosine(1402)-N(4))-methyltransferase RsmH [Flavobacteriales bacterium]MBT4881583.1 16S rRNA (cytosine(1402)-N(4))-methyltransferase RsmH [Flavobacteriales bacterium]MDG1348151.1 16S rRNA (cytosine(1402)-N(4))-methyltransferase RsmH [Flavobacteriales bacterium]